MEEIKLDEQDLLFIKMNLTPILGGIRNLYPDEQEKLSKSARYMIYKAMFDGAVQSINTVLDYLQDKKRSEYFHVAWHNLNEKERKKIINSWIKSVKQCEE